MSVNLVCLQCLFLCSRPYVVDRSFNCHLAVVLVTTAAHQLKCTKSIGRGWKEEQPGGLDTRQNWQEVEGRAGMGWDLQGPPRKKKVHPHIKIQSRKHLRNSWHLTFNLASSTRLWNEKGSGDISSCSLRCHSHHFEFDQMESQRLLTLTEIADKEL